MNTDKTKNSSLGFSYPCSSVFIRGHSCVCLFSGVVRLQGITSRLFNERPERAKCRPHVPDLPARKADRRSHGPIANGGGLPSSPGPLADTRGSVGGPRIPANSAW